MAVIALIGWWSCNAFIPTVADRSGARLGRRCRAGRAATLALVEEWKTHGDELVQPRRADRHAADDSGGEGARAARLCSRSTSPAAASAIFATFGLDCEPVTRLYWYFLIGVTVFGVFGSFTYYLPELFPTRLRGTGAGFCYNIGRVLAAVGTVPRRCDRRAWHG